MNGWVEPAAALPLRWGGWSERRWAGLVLIAGGLVHLQAASTTNLLPLVVGTAAHTLGWLIMPAHGWRRLVPLLPSGLVVWIVLTGPQSMWTLAIPFLCWLLVRHRPWRSLLALGPVLLNGVAATTFFREYDAMPLALGISAIVLVGSSWWAWALARPQRASSSASSGNVPVDAPPSPQGT